MRMWLVQRGIRREGDFKGLTGKDGLVDLDYMGSSEFEWGAIPRAFRRIMGQFSDYVFHKTNLTNINNCPLWIYVRKEKVEDVENCIKEYLEKKYQLQEWIALEHHFDNKLNISSSFGRHFYLRFNFWWDIQNDWIAFVGADDVKEQYNMAINYDYRNWWLAKPEEERKSELEAAYAQR